MVAQRKTLLATYNYPYQIPSKVMKNNKLNDLTKISLNTLYRTSSKKFEKKYKRRYNENGTISQDISIKRGSYVTKKLINNNATLQNVASKKNFDSREEKLGTNNLLLHDADVESIRKKYNLPLNRKVQKDFVLGFRINYYQSISLTSFKNYINLMELFYTTFTYNIVAKKNDNNNYLISFNYFDEKDVYNVFKTVYKLTFLNIHTNKCHQESHSVQRDQKSFSIPKEPHFICLFEMYQQGLTEKENYGKGLFIF
ncbi:Hypothetical protein SRAE_2000072150 [Strongyloides ratti]|uniref:Uncharacterized protein n=1 Tax=Strongyloides ratti TaxID=34506 RepID=A0A090L8D5_STRRB|nr:Hypothetical protein SRAE_2000072150 [Strongyloides ratti]CEF66051.1 Hypothetical protein SRAE_2000072150 [Strongyloides ratti]